MDHLSPTIVAQVEELERLRAAGVITERWYRDARAELVRRHREARRRTEGGLEHAEPKVTVGANR